MLEFNEARAAELRDRGMQASADHADRVHVGWGDAAFGICLIAIGGMQPEEKLTSETMRMIAEQKGLPEPPDKRAWGKVMLRLAKSGKIRKSGWTEAKTADAHKRPINLWAVV